MPFFTVRRTNLYAFLLCGFLIIASYYFQYGLLLEPCSLCIVQRFLVILLAFLFLLGAALSTTMLVRLHCVVTAMVAGLGAASAARKLWIQHNLLDAPLLSCEKVDSLLESMPFFEMWRLVLQGEGPCNAITWQFLGLSMSAWTLVFFLLFIVLAWTNFFRSSSRC